MPPSAPRNVRVVVEVAVDRAPDGARKGTVDHDRVLDHNYVDTHEWIAKTTYWAARNGRSVTITPVER
jgi:hypothetical protein